MCKRWIFQQSKFDYQRVHVSNRSRKSKLSHCHSFDHIPGDPQLRAISIHPATASSRFRLSNWAPCRRCHGPPRPLPLVRAMGVCVAKPATCRDGPSPQGDGRKSLGAARGWWGELGQWSRTWKGQWTWDSDLICF